MKYVHGDQIFFCHICGDDFKRKENLKKHMKNKHGESGPQIFPCPQCDYKATQKSALSRHIKTVHESQEFPCDYCDKVFGRKDNLNAHVKKNHSKRKATEDLSGPAKQPRLLYGYGASNVEPEKEKNPQPDPYENPQPGPSHQDPEDHQDPEPQAQQIVNGNPDHSIEDSSSFKTKIWERKYMIRGQKDLLQCLYKYKAKYFRSLIKYFKRKHGGLNFYIDVQTDLQKVDHDGNVQEASPYFSSGTRRLTDMTDYNHLFEKAVSNILESFEQWVSEDSGWVLKRINFLRSPM